MKKMICLLITCLCLGGCARDLPLIEDRHVFQAEIIEKGYKNLLVEGLNNGMNGPYSVSFRVSENLDEYEERDIVEIVFDGIVAESYPGQINAEGIKLVQKAPYGLTLVNDEPVDGLIHYVIENKTNKTKYTWVPRFQELTDDGEWVDVELIDGVCGNKDMLEGSYQGSIPIDAHDFSRNGIVRLSIPIYNKDNTDLDKPDYILISDEFYLDVGK